MTEHKTDQQASQATQAGAEGLGTPQQQASPSERLSTLPLMVAFARIFRTMGIEARAAAESLAAGEWTPELDPRSERELEALFTFVVDRAASEATRHEARRALAQLARLGEDSQDARPDIRLVMCQLGANRARDEEAASILGWRWDTDGQRWLSPNGRWAAVTENSLAGSYRLVRLAPDADHEDVVVAERLLNLALAAAKAALIDSY